MSQTYQILHLEDIDDDAELVAASLGMHGLDCEIRRARSRDTFSAALKEGGMDIILSDFSLPDFDGLSALEQVRKVCPEVPFIFVSGTLGEEVAIDALQSGASDYVFKHRLRRLGPAVERAVEEAEKRRELQRAEKAMIQSEYKYRQLFECLSEAALLADARTGRVIDTNRQAEVLFGQARAQILGKTVERLLSPHTFGEYRERLGSLEAHPERVIFEGEIRRDEGGETPVVISASQIVLYERRLVLGLYRDVSNQRRVEAELRHLQEQLSQGTV